MNAVQIHLALSHLPVLGLPAGAVLLVVARVSRSELMFKTACGFLLASAVFAAGSYFSGPPSYELVDGAGLVEKAVVERHALFGQASFVGMILLAAVTLGALIQYLQGETPGPALRWTLLAAALALTLLLAWTAHAGGQIRHPELEALTAIRWPLPAVC